MRSTQLIRIFAGLLATSACSTLMGQHSAPSSHLVFNDHFDGDILINEVRVPEDGLATYTYYETLGWRGTGAGYAGIQAHPKAPNFIFSIWDNKTHTAAIKALYHGPGTRTERFGGEGTGLKSWNFELGWTTDVWYTLVARCWPVGDHSHYGFWARAGDTETWTHLVTMDVASSDTRFRGGTDAFIEDWVNSGKHARTSHLRKGWKRKLDGVWFPFTEARYSVNAWDLKEGKRSYNYRTNWDGGIAADQAGPYYYMTCGGDTKPSTRNPSEHTIKRSDTSPRFLPIAITRLFHQAKGEMLEVGWKVDPRGLPQFSGELQVLDAGKALVTQAINEAHTRKTEVAISTLDLETKSYKLQLRLTDIFDGVSKPFTISIGKGASLVQ